jgi:quercetin dioxygenase-like cupin family protein
VSQAERGRRGLSLETLLDACTKLDLTLDELLRGDVNPGYRLARRHDPRRRADGRPLPLIDDRQAGLRAYLLTLAPRQHATPHLTHKGVELVAVVAGLVQVQLDSGRPVLRRGETLLAERSAVLGWRNLGESDATLFWILRDG